MSAARRIVVRWAVASGAASALATAWPVECAVAQVTAQGATPAAACPNPAGVAAAASAENFAAAPLAAADACKAVGDIAAAKQILADAAQRASTYPSISAMRVKRLLTNIGVRFNALKDLRSALDVLQRAFQIDTGDERNLTLDIDLPTHLAYAMDQVRGAPAGHVYWMRALEAAESRIPPDRDELRITRINAMSSLFIFGDPDQAAQVASRAWQAIEGPGYTDVEARIEVADQLLDYIVGAGQIELAQRLVDAPVLNATKGRPLGPTFGSMLKLRLSRLLMRTGRFDEALATLATIDEAGLDRGRAGRALRTDLACYRAEAHHRLRDFDATVQAAETCRRLAIADGEKNASWSRSRYFAGAALTFLGDVKEARRALQESIAFDKASKPVNRLDLAMTLFSLARLEEYASNLTLARDLTQEALSLTDTPFDGFEWVRAIANGKLGQYADDISSDLDDATGAVIALGLYERAIADSEKDGNQTAFTALMHVRAAEVNDRVDKDFGFTGGGVMHTKMASDLLRRIDQPDATAEVAAYELGMHYAKLSRSPQAGLETLYDQLNRFTSKYLDGTWGVEIQLSAAHAALGQDNLAVFWGKRAINDLQGLRARMADLDPAERQRFVAARAWPYTRLADILIEQGRYAEAQQVLEMLKERELYDDVSRGGPAPSGRVELTGIEREANLRFYEIRSRQTELMLSLRRLDNPPGGRHAPGDARQRSDIEAQLQVVERTMKTFMAGLEDDLKVVPLDAQGRKVDFAAAQSRLFRVVQDLGSAQGDPAAGGVGVQYVLAPNRLSILLTVPGSAQPLSYQIPIDAKEFRDRVLQFARDLKRPGSSLERAQGLDGLHDNGRYLYDKLIQPMVPELARLGARTLMLSLTDVLRFLPFAALYGPDTQRYLVEDYALAVYNEAAIDDAGLGQMTRAPSGAWHVAGMGLSDAVGDLKALPAVEAELRAATRIAPIGRVWLNKDFTLLQMRSAMSGPYNVLHVASHFSLDMHSVPNSRLYLGDKSVLTLRQIQQDSMRFDGLELVVLSACETAASAGRESYGQEFESLAATVQRRKAAAVLATLWSVADRSTAELMGRFYSNRSGRMNKALALQQAQIAMIRGDAALDPEWRNPYHWAPFVLMGNWR